MLKIIDAFLNKITMYRLTLYYLIGLLAIAFGLSFTGAIPFSPLEVIIAIIVAVAVSAITNAVLATLFHAITNIESVFITALILVLIVPIHFPSNLILLIATCVLAIASKYLFTVERRHLLNPAAAGAVAVALLSNQSATWWVGTPIMMPFVLIGGLLLVRKIQREKMVITFLAVYFLLITVAAFLNNPSFSSLYLTWQLSIVHSALFFFAFVMFTEPLTSPPTQQLQQYFAAVVAVFYSTLQLRFFQISFTPEMALCIGNIFSFIVSPKYRLLLPLKWRKQLTPDTYLFGFDREKNFTYIPGQYMEWTLPHSHADNRGNRRYFSLASSPTEPELSMLVKFYDPPSSYKKALLAMKTGDEVVATSLAGDFVLPKNVTQPLAFIAGGVGIAPFRSMIKYIIDQQIRVNIVLIFANKTIDEIVYQDELVQAEQFGVRTVHILTKKEAVPPTWTGRVGHLTPELIQADIPDYLSRIFYISGPQSMVQSFEELLASVNIPKKQIKVDFFPGY